MPVEVTFKGQRDAGAAYQPAIDFGHADPAPKAAVNLGVLRAGQGDAAGAGAAYQPAIDSGHVDQAPKAAVNLGVLRAGQGDVAGATVAFQLAIDSGHADMAALAREELGHLGLSPRRKRGSHRRASDR
jgi:Tfp pilus assembly protein PilF